MKKTLLSFVFIFSVIFTFGQSMADSVQYFEVITMDQDTFNLNEFWEENPDKKVALEFFFVDSPLCKEISPMISEAYKSFGCNEHDIFFLSVNVSDDSASVANYRDTLNIETPMVLSTMGGTGLDSLCQIHAYPTLVLLQKETFIPENDTIWEDEENEDIDTIYVYTKTNFLEKDIWPITDADSLINILISHGINEYVCSGNGNNNSTGIAKKDSFNQLFNLYPNPNKGQFYITSSEIEGEFDIEILDLSGKIMFSKQAKINLNELYEINNIQLKKGIYLIRLRNQKEAYTEKLIIQ